MLTPRNLKLHYSPPFPVVHNQLLRLADIEGEVDVLAPHCQVTDHLPIGCLTVVSDQANYRCDVSKLEDGVRVMRSHSVVGEPRENSREHILEGPRLEGQQRGCCLPDWGRPVRKSGIQLQRVVFSPRVLSLVMSIVV
jgi:hypothetical protein